MKIHYTEPFNPQAVCNLFNYTEATEDHKKVTCLKCIQQMDDNERAWHDKNNSEWVSFTTSSDKWVMVDDKKSAPVGLFIAVGVLVVAMALVWIF